ncbi:MAG: symmetrical bis(5'-nucleosyl)-tetraphosphatase [Betaproteobacteria bacterium]
MSTYAIGDLQGCFDPLRRLLDEIQFDAGRDRLWLVGDLVNRGPDSLAVLRFVKGLGTSAISVLGNHDLHLLALAGGHTKAREGDTLDAVLNAPDRDELLAWLRACPLLYHEQGYALVHAGLLPMWTIEHALSLAEEVHLELRGDEHANLLGSMYGNQPARWSETLEGYPRLRLIVNAMTRMRVCSGDGDMVLGFKGGAVDIPAGLFPWFDAPNRASAASPIIFGHWSALGLQIRTNVVGLDSGCLWGRQLSALRLEDRQLYQVACPGAANPRRPQ